MLLRQRRQPVPPSCLATVLLDAATDVLHDPGAELRAGNPCLRPHPQRIDLRPGGVRHAGLSAQSDVMSDPDPTSGRWCHATSVGARRPIRERGVERR